MTSKDLFLSLVLVLAASQAEASPFLNLLHYDNGKSLVDEKAGFFLSDDGFENSEHELAATLKAFQAKSPMDDGHAICRFPARFAYVSEHVPGAGKDFVKPKCLDYEIFEKRAPIDKVSIMFAAENNKAASTAMGHIFLKISGKAPDGKLREHAFSYFAASDEHQSLMFYFDALFNEVDGSYALSPYKRKKDEYLLDEKRIVWEIELKLSPEQKEMLRKHMWELKGQNVRYSFIDHNCGTALMNLLKVAYPDMDLESSKAIDTPIDYIIRFRDEGRIEKVSFEKDGAISRPPDLLKAKKSSRIYAGYRSFNGDFLELSVRPLYQDFFEVNNAQADDLGTKMLELNLRHDFDRTYVNRIDFLELKSIIGNDFGKYFRLALESDLGNENSSLKPVVQIGGSYALSFAGGRIVPYVMPSAGYRYNHYNNFYIVPEIGLIMRPAEKVKLVLSYDKYFDSKGDNRGFDEKATAVAAYELSENWSLTTQLNSYTGEREFTFGIGYGF